MTVQNYLRLAKEYLGFSPENKYIYSSYFDSFIILLAFFVLSKLIVIVSEKIILRLTRRTKTQVDDLIVKRINGPISLILLLIGMRLALLPLGIRQSLLDIAENFITSFIIIIITYIAIIVFDIFIDNWGQRIASRTESTLDDELIPIFHKFSRIFISLIGLLFALPVWGVQIGPLLASLGIAGIAIAFALQSTLGNIFGGISIILDKSIKVGDKIRVDTDTEGTVIDVGLRSTKIKTWDNEIITMPNGKLADSKILNFMQPEPSIRVVIEFGVEYGSDASKVRKVVLDTISRLPEALKEPAPKVLMMEMADFALKFKAFFWVKTFDIKFDTKALATEKIYNALREAGIKIPFPTRTVYLKKED